MFRSTIFRSSLSLINVAKLFWCTITAGAFSSKSSWKMTHLSDENVCDAWEASSTLKNTTRELPFFTLQIEIRIIFRTLSKCEVELFVRIVKGFQPLTTLAKISIFNVWLRSEYAFDRDSFLALFIKPKLSRFFNIICFIYSRIFLVAFA